ncbi:PREDICTED: uncharacterized protein LOC102263324 isoform X2 [Myotis brandtii]|uniref:uncharacterized protein LOC102263324 isoform X2 n=1 Tax=Myotis brandtii TaxID=109478 RepID=UPI000703F093|nr:PREDICTED: uncharacterized protein LOC102263324 isoform X2 [Myotis brandtii]
MLSLDEPNRVRVLEAECPWVCTLPVDRSGRRSGHVDSPSAMKTQPSFPLLTDGMGESWKLSVPGCAPCLWIAEEGRIVTKGLSSAWKKPPCSLPGGWTWAGPRRSVAPGLPTVPGNSGRCSPSARVCMGQDERPVVGLDGPSARDPQRRVPEWARSQDPQEGVVVMKGLLSAWNKPPCSLPGGRTWAGPGRSLAPGLPHARGALGKVQPQRQGLHQPRREARCLPGWPESPGVPRKVPERARSRDPQVASS